MTETNTEATPASTEAAPQGKRTFIWGVGRRKSAVARVRIAAGSGQIAVNGRTLNDYFTAEQDRKAIFGPLEVTNTGGRMDIFVNATGGGPTGQAGAIVMGLGRALAKFDSTLEVALRGSGFLTRDSRMKERKKYGQRQAPVVASSSRSDKPASVLARRLLDGLFMNHIDAEMSDIVVVMDDCPTSKIDTLVENLKKAGVEVSDVDADHGVVEGTILSSQVKALQSVPCVKYVRSVFSYIADFPVGDPRNLDGKERESEEIPR